MKITYFVHGTTTDNERGIATGWNPGELSALGKRQAVELGQLVKGKTFDVVFCSDLKRAVDSAELAFGKQAIIDKRLRECDYGDLNGHPEEELGNKLAHIKTAFLKGERYSDVEKRMRSFLKDLQKKYAGKHVAIVSHQGPQLALEVIVNGKTWQQAFAEDWRLKKAWRPGWEYLLDEK